MNYVTERYCALTEEQWALNTKQERAAKFAQTQEPWELRAIKLQLIYPNWFLVCRQLDFQSNASRATAMSYFGDMHREGVLRAIEFGSVTPYRTQLLVKACRAHMRSMRRQEQARVREQATQSPSEA